MMPLPVSIPPAPSRPTVGAPPIATLDLLPPVTRRRSVHVALGALLASFAALTLLLSGSGAGRPSGPLALPDARQILRYGLPGAGRFRQPRQPTQSEQPQPQLLPHGSRPRDDDLRRTSHVGAPLWAERRL